MAPRPFDGAYDRRWRSRNNCFVIKKASQVFSESGGAADATSPAGAIGLMQIMPDTYAELRARYGLGANAYDPHDNIIAGTAYMSEMIERFGVPNFLAAYNAGPARLEDHLRRGRPLPEETQRYLAQIGELPVAAPPPPESPAPQSLPFVTAASNAPRSSPQMTSGSASALRTIGAMREGWTPPMMLTVQFSI